MIDRRSQGLFTLQTLLISLEMVVLWAGMAALSDSLKFYTYYSLLPAWSYWLAIAAGVTIAMRLLLKAGTNLVSLGWAGSAQLAGRQTVAVACAIFALAVATKDAGLSRVFVAYYLSGAWVVLTMVNRYQPYRLARAMVARGGGIPLLLMGRPENFPGLDYWLEGQRVLGFEPVGIIRYRVPVFARAGLPVAGDFDSLEATIMRTGAKEVLMLELPHSVEDGERIVKACSVCGCRLMMHNNLIVQLDRPLRAMSHQGYSFLVLHDEPLENSVNRCIKRGLDLAVAIPVVLLILPPLILLVSLMQTWQSPGRIFYHQMRAGRAGRPFRIWKFRTMGDVGVENLQQARRKDNRIFPFGRWLRRTSMDEMPQFLNVLRGEMSTVGPRPHLEEHEVLFTKSAEIYRMRFFVKPGITGLAQSRGLRGEATVPDEVQKRIQLDLLYIREWSVWLDLAIMARTVKQIVRPPSSAY